MLGHPHQDSEPMSAHHEQQTVAGRESFMPAAAMSTDDVKQAYRRWAGLYDVGFGLISSPARRRAIAAVNALPGQNVLEVGVGTGLALPWYGDDKQVTGIDLSVDMLARARLRATRLKLGTVVALEEMDAEDMTFEADCFDIAVAMFVASVVPNPRKLLAEMRRVVRPGGTLLFINHFARDAGPVAAVEAGLARASSTLGWHPDFRVEALLDRTERHQSAFEPQWPIGIFTLVHLPA
jgi:phosphatidylethanolamine/phosphatidyl-N-methylethanolamine N-methyltransferase